MLIDVPRKGNVDRNLRRARLMVTHWMDVPRKGNVDRNAAQWFRGAITR